MSNKLKTLSAHQIEHFISEKIGKYIGEDCTCTVSDMDTPNIDTEADAALDNERNLNFKVKISYLEDN